MQSFVKWVRLQADASAKFQQVIHPEKLRETKSVGLNNEFLEDAKPLVGFSVEFPRCQQSIFEVVWDRMCMSASGSFCALEGQRHNQSNGKRWCLL